MADKKTFTIEINGIEKAYDNTIKLRDAIKQLENIEINVKDNVSDSLNRIEQNYNQINKTIEVSKNVYQDLNDTIQTNTDTLAENNKESSNNVSISATVITSINQRKESLQDLKKEYDNLSEAQRDNSDGPVILEMIREEERAIANATIEMANFNKEIQTSIAINSEEMGSLNQKKIVLEQLKEEYNKLSEIQRNSSDGAAIIEMIQEEEVAIGLATKTLDSFSESNKRLVEIFKEEEGSIAQKKVLLENLKVEYEKLGAAERNAAEGNELIFAIKATEKEIETLTRRIDNNLQVLSDLGASIDIVSQGFNQASSTLVSFKDILSSGAEVAKALGVENESLNNAIEGLSRVTETLNTLQAFHTSLVNKDSIIMKAATTAKKLYTAAVQGSSVSLKGFKLALASTGIGAILVLVGALITNFDGIKKTVSENVTGFDKFQELLSKLEPVLAGVGNALVQLLLNPVKQIMNAVGGLIDIISIFKEKGTDGFKEAFDVIGNTANNAKDIMIESYDVIGNYNKGVQDKIVSNEKEANKKRMIDDAKLKDDFIKNSEAKNGTNWKFTKEGYEAYQAYFAAQALLYEEDSEEFAELMRKKMSYEREFTESNKLKGSTGSKRDYKQEQKDYEDALQNLKDSTQEYQNETLEKEIEFNRKMIEVQSGSEITESRKLEIENLKKSLAENIDARKKAFDEEIKGIKDKHEAKEKAGAAEIALQQAKLEAEKQITQAEMDAINEVLATRREAVTSLEEVHKKERELQQEKFKKEQTDVQKQYDELLQKNILDKAKRLILEEAFQKKMEALKKKQESEESSLKEKQNKETSEAQTKVNETEVQANLQKIDMDKEYVASQQKMTNLLKEDKVERDGLGLIDVKTTKENYKKAIEADKEYLEELKKNKDAKIKLLDELIAESEGDSEKQAIFLALKAKILKDYEAESSKIQSRINDNTKKETDVLKSKYDELYDKIKEKWDNINTVMTTVGAALTSALKGQLDELKEKQEEITKQYEEAVEKHKESQEKLKSLEEEAKTATGGRAMVVQEQIARQMEANNQLAAQEKDLAKQKEKAEKDAAKKEKQMKKVELGQQLITGIANIAMGITKALAMGPIIGPIMAGIVGAMGAIQTATIAKQMSKLEDGGMLSGKRHSQGGMRIEGTNIEVEGDEYVVNRISTRKNLGLINYINKNRKELKAEDINSYFARTGTSQQQIKIPTKQMYEQGGMLTNLEVVDSIGSPDNDRILEAISQINFKPVVSVVDITSAQNNLSEVKDIAGA